LTIFYIVSSTVLALIQVGFIVLWVMSRRHTKKAMAQAKRCHIIYQLAMDAASEKNVEQLEILSKSHKRELKKYNQMYREWHLKFGSTIQNKILMADGVI